MPASGLGDRWMLREWDDGCVVYDRRSGDTHALDALSTELLALPPDARYDAPSAAAALAEALDFSPGQDWLERVSVAFDHLHRIELI